MADIKETYVIDAAKERPENVIANTDFRIMEGGGVQFGNGQTNVGSTFLEIMKFQSGVEGNTECATWNEDGFMQKGQQIVFVEVGGTEYVFYGEDDNTVSAIPKGEYQGRMQAQLFSKRIETADGSSWGAETASENIR